jgi:methyl-accepting chemotaxis protein
MLLTVDAINQVVAESAVKVRETRSTSEQLLALSSELNKRLAQFDVGSDAVLLEQESR